MADRTYKQWYDYHLARLKKDPKMKNAGDNALKILAGDQAQRSYDAQEKAKKSGGGTLAGAATSGMDMPAPLPTPSTNRVGPSGSVPAPAITKNPTVIKPTPAPTTTAVGQVPANASDPNTYNNRMQSRIAALGIQGYTVSSPRPVTNAIEFLATLTDQQYAELAKVLKRLDYDVKEKGRLKDVLITYFEELFPVKDYSELLTKLKGRAIAGTGADEADLPDRRIGQIDRGALVEIAQAVADKGMFKLTEQELNEIIAPWEKKLGKGTLTTTKKVRNPKTGKLENVTTTTSAFRQGEEELALEKKLKETRPQQFQLAEAISFRDEIMKTLLGGA